MDNSQLNVGRQAGEGENKGDFERVAEVDLTTPPASRPALDVQERRYCHWKL